MHSTKMKVPSRVETLLEATALIYFKGSKGASQAIMNIALSYDLLFMMRKKNYGTLYFLLDETNYKPGVQYNLSADY